MSGEQCAFTKNAFGWRRRRRQHTLEETVEKVEKRAQLDYTFFLLLPPPIDSRLLPLFTPIIIFLNVGGLYSVTALRQNDQERVTVYSNQTPSETTVTNDVGLKNLDTHIDADTISEYTISEGTGSIWEIASTIFFLIL